MANENEASKSNVVISSEVVSKIIKTSALETEGVAYVSNQAPAIRNVLGKKVAKGAGLKTEGESLDVNVGLAVYSGYDVVEVSKKVQGKIRDNIDSMTGIDCVSVNIDVTDIVLKERAEAEVE